MLQRSPLLNVMVAAAQKAGRSLTRDFGEVEQLQVSKKGPADFVTVADEKAERIIFEELAKARPKYGFLMEERGAVDGADTSNRWIVDPLDGTLNFLHGIPQFAVSIGLERDGESFAGVIYDPIGDNLFVAEKGQGAHHNNRRIRVSGRRRMDEALFATGIPFLGVRDHPQFLDELESIMGQSAGVRRFGAAALDLAWVACGRFDGFWESGLSPWDLAAGIIIVKEAGGYVSDYDGKGAMIETGNIIAANASIHAAFTKQLTTARSAKSDR